MEQKIYHKKGESEEGSDEFTGNENSWFYTNGKNLHYFLEENSNANKDMKDKNTVKKQSCLNLGNSEKSNPKCETEEKPSYQFQASHRSRLMVLQNSVDNSEMTFIRNRRSHRLQTMKKRGFSAGLHTSRATTTISFELQP